MSSRLSIAISLAFSIAPLLAQPVSVSELTARHKLNQSRYTFLDNGADLLLQAKNEGHDITRTVSPNIDEGICTDCGPTDDSNHWKVKQAVSESDLVAVGTVSQKTPMLTKKRAFVFTDYEFIVEDVWKSTQDSPPVPGSEITITSVGGSVTVEQHVITATIRGTLQLEKGDRYLLFLKYIPESRSYEPVSLFGFDVTGSTVRPLQTKTSVPVSQYLQNLSSFMQAMRQSTDHAIEEEKK